MIRLLRTLWRRHPILVPAFVLASLLALLFGLRLMIGLAVWVDPDRRSRPVADWMTPRFVVHAYGIAPQDLAQALGLPMGADGAPRRSLADLARDQGLAPADLVARVEALRQAAPPAPGSPAPGSVSP